MRIANIAGRAHLVVDGRAADIETLSEGRFPADPMGLFPRWAELSAWAERVGSVDGHAFDPGTPPASPPGQGGLPAPAPAPGELAAPVPRPRQVFAVASNYRDRPVVLETPADLPVTFTKFPSCVVGPYADVPLPTDTVDWEVELVVVVGRPAHRITPAEAWGVVAGLTVGQDLSERTLQLGGATRQFALGKSFPNFGPTGPVLVTPDEFADRDDIALRCSINGEIVQDGRTSQMIFPVPQLISRLSMICTLLPGDLIFSGTPGGMGMLMDPPRYLKVGDEIVSEIDGIGALRNRCTAPVEPGRPRSRPSRQGRATRSPFS